MPYHLARLNAFAQRRKGITNVVELTDRDSFKVLECAAAEQQRFLRHTLFPQTDPTKIDSSKINALMAEFLDRLEPAVVCVNGWGLRGAAGVLSWCLKNGRPAVIVSESTRGDAPRVAWKEFLKAQFVNLCSSGIVGGTPHAAYLNILGMPPSRIFKGYDVVDNQYFGIGSQEARRQPQEARLKFGIPQQSYFLACARFEPKKNLARLIRAYNRYRAKCRDAWMLVILGDGRLRSELEELIHSINLAEHVLLPGAKPYSDLPAWYGLAECFVHASSSEQWGLVVNEAMACNLPVVVSDRCGCATDLVQTGANGITFDPLDENAMADALLRISSDCTDRFQMGKESRRIVSAWSPEKFASSLEEAVACALQAPPKQNTWQNRLVISVMNAGANRAA